MSETKFTKGEWYTSHCKGDHKRYVMCSGKQIATVAFNSGKTNLKANANLIAAAPEMYAILETVLSEMYGLIDEVNDQRMSRMHPQIQTPPDLHDDQTLHKIQMLLAKARGEV
jgi:hypothetical protein